MAIELLDDERPEEINEGEELASLDEPQQEPEQDNLVEEDLDDGLPDKYKGKSATEIARMHMEAEKALGRQGGEVGELRKIVDDFVKAQLETKTAQTQPTVTEDESVDWYLDPEKAVEQAISNHPKLKEAEAITLEMKRNRALEALKQKHPDFMEVIQSKSFGEWVEKSRIRKQLLAQADKEYDTEAADELLTTWKERSEATQAVVNKERSARKQQVKSASTGSVAGSGEAPARKIYRRADIIKLMQTDPDRYMQLADEIALAYAEKRVK